MHPKESCPATFPVRWVDYTLRFAILIAATMAVAACGGEPSEEESAAFRCDRSSLLIVDTRVPGRTTADSILIEDGVIAWIGDAEDAPPHDETLDAKGAIALPGLIDSHTHFDALAAAKHLQQELDAAVEIFPITMRQTLASGVTTVRAHLSALDDMVLIQTLSKDDCFPSPRIVISGPGLLGGAPNVNAPLMRGVENAEDAAAKVNELANHGADWVALHGLTRFSDDELTAILDAARGAGLKLLADTDDFADLELAVASPIRSGEYLNRSGSEAYPLALIEAIDARSSELYVVPPVGYYLRSAEYARSEERALDPRLFLFTDPDIKAQMIETFDAAFNEDEYIAEIVESSATLPRKFEQINNSGAILVIGSDSGSLGQFHHDAIWQEMTAWHTLGAEPEQIVDAATVTAAHMLDLDDIGYLAVGARGDVLLYSGDIFGGDFDRSKVEAVIKGGVIFVSDGQWIGPNTEDTRSTIEQVRALGGQKHFE